MEDVGRATRYLLVIAHPGHELRVYGWAAQARPWVCILTDGSGSDRAPRIENTLATLKALGAKRTPICGELSDRRVYEYFVKQESAPLEAIGRRLAQLILEEEIDTVVSDGLEGYNPIYDLCYLLTRAAVATAANTGRPCRHYTIPLMGDPRKPPRSHASEVREIDLSPAVFQRKLQAMREYAELGGPTFKREIEATIQNFGQQAFAREYLFAATPQDHWELPFEQEKPSYETYGEQQVAAGRYQSVIRFREHFLPIAKRLSMLSSAFARDAKRAAFAS